MSELFTPAHLIVLMFVFGIGGLVQVIPMWIIADKAGLTKSIAFLGFFPFWGVVVLYYIALSKWPRIPQS